MPEAAFLATTPPAFQVLVSAIDPWLDDESRGRAAQALSDDSIDWMEVRAHAHRHRLAPFLAHRLEQLGLMRTLPADLVASLRHEALVAQFHEMAMLALLDRLKRAFDDDGIGFLVIKGLVLSAECYGAMGLRVNRDIDLLIQLHDLLPADAVLRRLGFRRIEPHSDISGDALSAWTRRKKDWVYQTNPAGIIIELHHRPFDNRALSMPDCITRARTISLFGKVDVQTFAESDEIAFLALHGSLHAWSRLKWLADLALLIRSRGEAALDGIRGKGPERRALRQAVHLCEDLFGSGPPPSLKRTMVDRLLVEFARKAIAGNGTVELEDSVFGTTIKNVSHYLLSQQPAYLREELIYDLSDTSRDNTEFGTEAPNRLMRPARWLARHYGAWAHGSRPRETAEDGP